MPLEVTLIKGGSEEKPMAWTKKRSPLLPTPPAPPHPSRCRCCGHLAINHDAAVGCLIEGGTMYIENEKGEGKYVCSCESFVPVPPETLAADAKAIAEAEGVLIP